MSLNPEEETNLKRFDSFLGSNILKFSASVLLAIYALGKWTDRMEQLPKDIASELIKQIDDVKSKQEAHELSDKYEKQILNTRIDNVIAVVNELKSNRQRADLSKMNLNKDVCVNPFRKRYR